MRFGFDIDEVVARSVEKVLTLLGKIYNRKWTCNNIYCYSFEKICFVEDDKLNKRVVKDLIKLVNDPDVQSMFEPYEDAVGYLKKYKKEGHSLHFVSARPTEEDNTVRWFKKWSIPFDSIHHIIGGKGSVVKSLGLDCFVEDCPGCLDKIIEKNLQTKLFLLDKRWNVFYSSNRVVRIYSWEELDYYLGGAKWAKK